MRCRLGPVIDCRRSFFSTSRNDLPPGSSCNTACQQRTLHDSALAATRGLTRVLAPLHLGNHELERLEHVLVVARARLGPRALELLGEGFAVLGRDLALLGAEVRLVAYNDNGDPVDGLGHVY